ncbi:MAG: SAM-dependent methyltransferase [Spirulina sp.]
MSLDFLLKSYSQILEERRSLSRSFLWQIQRHFFQNQGVGAWNTHKVPHYVTNHPTIANAYAQVVFAFLRDCDRDSEQPLDFSQPLYILELGAGTGRFAFHFLQQFLEIYDTSVLKDIPIRYVLTDFSSRTLQFWQTHPQLQPFVERGLLDFACYDVQEDSSIELASGSILRANTLKNPLVVLGNYFFDSIPQDLYRIRDGQLEEMLVTLHTLKEEIDLDDPFLLETLQISYDYRPTSENRYGDPACNRVLRKYQHQLTDTHLLFPSIGLFCLDTLRRLSGDRLLLLSADKSYTRLDLLEGRKAPKLAFHHGSFSLMVNYHAIARYTEERGGQALVTQHYPQNLNICAFLFGHPPGGYIETRQGYRSFIEQLNPDDFGALKKMLSPHYATFSLQQILAYLRFRGWDAKIFSDCFPTIRARIPTSPKILHEELRRAIACIWNRYYFIGERENLPLRLATLLHEMGDEDEAQTYLDYAVALYGEEMELSLD